MGQCVRCLWTQESLKLARKEVSYNISIEFGSPMKLVTVSKIYLNGSYNVA